MREKVFNLEYELRDHIKSIRFSLEKSESELRTIKQNISIMTRELKTQEAELVRRKKRSAKKELDAAQRDLDVLDGKPVRPKPPEPVLCGNKDPSGYMPPCSYSQGHSGVCEGRYDRALVDRINRNKELM